MAGEIAELPDTLPDPSDVWNWMKERDQWLLWSRESNPPKKPIDEGFNPEIDNGTSWNDPAEWLSFERAYELARTDDRFDGIGFVVSQSDPYYGIDVDSGLRESFEEKPKSWVPKLDTFRDRVAAEFSTSGTGFHLFGEGQLPEWWSDSDFSDREHEGVDAYEEKFFIVTGETLSISADEPQEVAPTPWLLKAYKAINGKLPDTTDDSASGEYDSEIAKSEIEDALEALDPDMSHTAWVKIGFAVYDWDSGATGKSVFEQWSRQGAKWDSDAKQTIEWIWSNASDGGNSGTVSVGTLIHEARENGWTFSTSNSHTSGGNTPEDDTTDTPLAEAIDSEWFDPSSKVVHVFPVDGYNTEELAPLFETPDELSDEFGYRVVPRIFEVDGGEEFLEDHGDGWKVERHPPDKYSYKGQPYDSLSARELKNAVLEELPTNRVAYLPEREEWLWCDDGVWKTDGDGFVRRWLDGFLGPYYSGHVRREVMDQLQARTQKPERSFGGGPPGTIAAKNGLIDLENGEIKRDIKPTDQIRWTLATEFQPEADCPQWREFLGEVVEPDNIPLLQEFVGYCLRHWDVKRKKALMLLGPTDAGKSVFVDVVEELFGGEDSPATSSTSVQYLANERWGPARLVNTALNTRSDLGEGSIENTGKVKELIAGDSLDAEYKKKPVFQFKPTAKHIFAANRAPSRSVDDEAFWNRWLTVIFPQAIPREEQNDNLTEELLEELPGILNWAIEGYQRLEEQGHFTGEPLPYQNREKWERYGNSIEQWLDRCTEEEAGAFVPKWSTEERIGAYDSYVAFARSSGLEVETDNKFTSELKRRDGVSKTQRRIDGTQTWGYSGISLTDDAPGTTKDDTDEENSESSHKGSGLDKF